MGGDDIEEKQMGRRTIDKLEGKCSELQMIKWFSRIRGDYHPRIKGRKEFLG